MGNIPPKIAAVYSQIDKLATYECRVASSKLTHPGCEDDLKECSEIATELSSLQSVDDMGAWAECGTSVRDACECSGKIVDKFFAIRDGKCGSSECVWSQWDRVNQLVERFGVENDCGTKRCESWAYTEFAKYGLYLGTGIVTKKEQCKNYNAQAENTYYWHQNGVKVPNQPSDWHPMSYDVNVASPELGCCISECTVNVHRKSDNFITYTPGMVRTDIPETAPASTRGALASPSGQMCYRMHYKEGKPLFLDPSKQIYVGHGDALFEDNPETAFCCIMNPCEYQAAPDQKFGWCTLDSKCSGKQVGGRCPDPSADIKCCNSWDEDWPTTAQIFDEVYASQYGSLATQLGLQGRDNEETIRDPARRVDGADDLKSDAASASLAAAAVATAAAIVA